MSVSLLSQEYTTEASGSRHVVERYIDHLGVGYMRTYFAAPAFDIAAHATAYIPQLEAQLAQSEIDELFANG